MAHFISASCAGEYCGMCSRGQQKNIVQATHKINENVFWDDPDPDVALRHPFTQYVCCEHFCEIMGPAALEKCK